MASKITKKEIIKLLQNSQKNLSDQPNLWRVLTYKKMDFNKNDQSIDFDVEVSFQNHNYLSIARDLYNADFYGNISEGSFSNLDFSYVSNLKNIIKQLIQDGYIVTEKQKVNYYTEYGKKTEYNEDGQYEIYLKADKFFLKEEKDIFETSLILTTKGQNSIEFWRDKVNSEIIGSLSLIIACISLIISILK